MFLLFAEAPEMQHIYLLASRHAVWHHSTGLVQIGSNDARLANVFYELTGNQRGAHHCGLHIHWALPRTQIGSWLFWKPATRSYANKASQVSLHVAAAGLLRNGRRLLSYVEHALCSPLLHSFVFITPQWGKAEAQAADRLGLAESRPAMFQWLTVEDKSKWR